MKKLMFIAACFVFFGAGTAFAQQDTTRRTTPTQTTPSDRMRDDMTGWTKVEASDVPEQIRTTLNDNKYKGWESGTIYKNQAGDTYSLQTADGKKTYYFDRNGKMTKRPNDRGN